MPSNLPYVASPGTVKTALERIRAAATPARFTVDFVNTVLQMKGGTGSYMPPFFKRIGFVASDGTPTEIYRRFRNPTSAGAAMAEAIKHGYQDLSRANEYFYRLGDRELLALIVQVTGVEVDNSAAQKTASVLKVLKSFANFDATEVSGSSDQPQASDDAPRQALSLPTSSPESGRVGLNLSYTINLNLPATADQAVFNAIFRSLKEHLLSSND